MLSPPGALPAAMQQLRRFALVSCLVLGACSDKPARDRAHLANAPLADRLAAADPARGAALFGRCAACHSIGKGAGDRDGPNLWGVVGAPVGHNSPRFAYTAALQRVGGRWTFDRLDRWLTNPQAFAPGTQMMFPGLPNGADRADVIAYLNANGSNLPLPRTAAKR